MTKRNLLPYFCVVLFLLVFLSACDLFSIKPRSNENDPDSTVYIQPEEGIPRVGLIAEYLFDGNADDTSGNNLHGTVNGATLTTDRFGNAGSAYSFDGVNDYIDLGLDIFTNSDTVTGSITGWFCSANYLASTDYSYILSVEGYFSLQIYNKGLETIFRGHVTETIQNFIESDAVVSTNTWYNLALTWDGSEIKIFIDGTQVGNSVFSGSPTPDAMSRNASIGTRFDDTGNRWNGLIDDVRVYNRALTEDEFKRIYDFGNWPDSSVEPDIENPVKNSSLAGGYWYNNLPVLQGWTITNSGAYDTDVNHPNPGYYDLRMTPREYASTGRLGTFDPWNNPGGTSADRMEINQSVIVPVGNHTLYVVGSSTGYSTSTYQYNGKTEVYVNNTLVATHTAVNTTYWTITVDLSSYAGTSISLSLIRPGGSITYGNVWWDSVYIE